MAPFPILHADCSRCQALCCVSLAFDQGAWFAFDKAADSPCHYLEPECACRIHDELYARGQAGCAVYDCYGAGQRVTQQLFPGVSWRSQPSKRRHLFETFRRLERVHELLLLLREATRLRLSSERSAELESLRVQLEPAGGLTADTLETLDLLQLEAAVRRWLRSLAGPGPERRGRSLPLLPTR